MNAKTIFFRRSYGELVYQVLVCLTLYIFYSYNQDGSLKILPYKIAFFTNYALSAFVINYLLLPKLYSQKRFLLFAIAVIFVVFIVIVLDEFVLEQIYFPNTRGTYFPGVLFTLLETLPLIAVFVGFKFAWDYNRKQSEIEDLKNLVEESELQFLKSQINPHFLFNNLNNLYALTAENPSKAQVVILELSSMLRYMLYDCKERFTSLEKEITNLRHYTALNELQIGDRGHICFNTNITIITTTNYVIAPLILVVFFENAFKHSMASQSKGIEIAIDINVNTKGFLEFKCKNSFLPGANTQRLAKGIGLSNVKKRLALLYENAHDLKIYENDNEFYVNLELQLNSIQSC